MIMQRRYFTRTELIVVMLIITILIGMLVPVLFKAREKARRVNCAARPKSLALAFLMYSGDYKGYFPNINSPQVGSWPGNFGNWQPLGSMQYIADTDNQVWVCPSAIVPLSDADCSNYRYIGSGLKDDNDSATLVSMGYDASGNHPDNAWMNATFIDGHVAGARPDGSHEVIIIERFLDQPDRTSTSSWNRNDW
jgi:prepilin-type processing-associated H-X9-DG protein